MIFTYWAKEAGASGSEPAPDADASTDRLPSARAQGASSRAASTRRCAPCGRSGWTSRSSSRRGEGAVLEDATASATSTGCMSWGPLVFGHADPEVVEAVQEAAADGTTFGAPTEREVELAEEIVDAVPSVEMVRLVSSGTEAAMTRGAARARRSRAATGSSSSPAATTATPTRCSRAPAPGSRRSASRRRRAFRAGAAGDTIVCPYNDVDAAAAAVERYGEGLAAILVEPVAGNMGVVPPAPGFLEALRALCDASRRAARLRRGDHRLPRRPRRRAGALRRHARPDHAREDRRRRAAARGLRRARRRDGASSRPSGAVYQAGTLSGQPARDRCGARRRCGACATRRSTSGSRRRARGSRPGSRRRPQARRCACSGSARWPRSSSRRGPCGTSRTPRRATPSATAPSSATCSRAASTSRRRSSRRVFVSDGARRGGDRRNRRGGARVLPAR